ncbi:biotin synthase BioB [Cellulosilyticum sp. I15G10I2]|uniref:biotin synthase BioB n=1 Tax=Cellulosilyticum sp. I15G10I2 TaxID=1892843 RepID=UPI00085BC96B|nr:biotin synthase BioB [Cellulosilyticum sp. I15G10I2]
MHLLDQLVRDIKAGYHITKEESIALLDYKTEDLARVADEIRAYFCGDHFDFCSIINGKSGKCSEDCKYCAQSAHYNTRVETYSLLSAEEFVRDAAYNARQGVDKYSIVTAGKKLSREDVEHVCEAYRAIGDQVKVKLCASHGLLDEEAMLKLKEAGVLRYHNNLETSRNFFPKICTTHTYDEKVETIKAAKRVGLEVCSGGILGLGESVIDRIDLAFELRTLEVDSIPLNMLNPIPGTPLENISKMTEDEFLKTAALFRFINPQIYIRLAGGRNLLSGYGREALRGGVNATLTGDLLTTCGNKIVDDIKMVKALGYTL